MTGGDVLSKPHYQKTDAWKILSFPDASMATSVPLTCQKVACGAARDKAYSAVPS